MTGTAPSGRRRERGATTMEAVISLALLATVAAVLVTASGRDFRFVRESHDEAAALRACAARLEAYAGGEPVPGTGERPFDLPAIWERRLPGARATETVSDAGPGLAAVEVRVSWRTASGEERIARLATLVAREDDR